MTSTWTRTHAEVRQAQRRLGLIPTGALDSEFTASLRTFQREHGLVVTGELDAPTIRALEVLPREGLLPEWYGKPGQSVVVALALGASTPDAIRRYQSARGLSVTGVVDEATARAIGD